MRMPRCWQNFGATEDAGYKHLPSAWRKRSSRFLLIHTCAAGHKALPCRARRQTQRWSRFVVAYTGEIMTMPGLPKSPAAERMDIDADGETIGLF